MGDVKSKAYTFEIHEKRNQRVKIVSQQCMWIEKLNEKMSESETGKKDQM